MKKLIKIFAVVVVVVVVIVGGLFAFVAMTFEPNDYKQEIVDAVKEQTGRDLKIDGDITLTFYPWLGVTTGAVELSNAAGFSPDVFASTERIAVRVKLMPLLSKSLEMDTVEVHGLVLNLAKDENGNTNWDDLTHEAQPTEAGEGPGISAFAIGGLDIRDANISWNDAQIGQLLSMSNLNAKTGSLTSGKPVDLSVEFDLAGEPGNLGGHFALSGELNMDPDNGQFDAKGLKFEANLTDELFLPGGKASFAFVADVSANMSKKTASVTNLTVSLLGLEASGNVTVSDYESNPQLSGDLSVKQFDPKSMLKQIVGVEIETGDPKAITAVAVDMTFSGSMQELALKPLKVVLDDSTLQSDLTLGSAIRFDLTLDEIDVDRYLPPATEGESAAADAGGGGADIPVDTLRGLDVDGQIKVGKLKIKNLSASNISVTLKAKDGVVNVSPITASLYDGTYSGNIGINAAGSQPKLTVDEKLSGIQAGPLLKDLQGEERLTGTGNIEAKMTAVGANADAMKKTLNGTAAFVFADGALNGINIAETIRNAKAKILGGSQSSSDSPEKTDFSELSGSFVVKNGFVTNEDLSAKSPLLRIDGKGNADLSKESIDYRATATVVATTEGQGGDDLSDLVGIPIPIKIGGTFSEPSYGLDFEALAGVLMKSKVGDLLEGVGGGAEGLIEGVSGGAEGLIEGVGEGAGSAVEQATELLKGDDEEGGGLLDGLLGN